MAAADCGWCGDAQVCENTFFPLYCAVDDPLLNPRGFTFDQQCAWASVPEQDVLSENKTGILVGAILGTLGVMAVALFIAAYFWRAIPVETFASGFNPPPTDGWNDSGIHEAAGKVHTTPWA
jgi:hypothetical protein